MQNFLGILCFSTVLCLSGCFKSEDATKSQTAQSHKINSPGITTPEALGMKFDVTTKEQVVDILNLRGYTAVTEQKEVSDPMLTYSGLRDISKPNKEQLKNTLKTMTSLSVIASPDTKEIMTFYFDKNQKLVMFWAKGKEKTLKLFSDAGDGKTILAKNACYKFKRDWTFEVFENLDDNTASYVIFSPKLKKLLNIS
jgi:hypothetical protein